MPSTSIPFNRQELAWGHQGTARMAEDCNVLAAEGGRGIGRINPAFPGGDREDQEQTRRWRKGIRPSKAVHDILGHELGLRSGLG